VERLVINEFSPTHTAAHSKSYSQNQRNNYLMSNFHTYHYITNLPKPERGKSDAQAVTNAQTSRLQRFRGVCLVLYCSPLDKAAIFGVERLPRIGV
jgi:hypothetical protein